MPGRFGEPAQVRCRDLAQFQRSEHRESQVEDARGETVFTRQVVLLEVAEGGDVAVRRAASEGELARQVADPECRAIGLNAARTARPRSSD